MTGKELEDLFEQKLIAAKVPYKREGQQVRRGGEVGKGKYDFSLSNSPIKAIECKEIGILSNLRIPWPKSKNTPLHSHQLKALREAGTPDEAGHLIYCTSTDTYYWMSMRDFDRIIIENDGLIVSFAGDRLAGLEIDLDEFVDKLKGIN